MIKETIDINNKGELIMIGGFTSFRSLSFEDKSVFDKALHALTSVDYFPIAVSSQVVNGINYKFLCEAAVVRPDVERYLAIVNIFQSTDSEVKLGDIEKLVMEK